MELEELFEQADKIALDESEDAETKVGAVVALVEEGIIVSAANTFIQGAKNLPNTRPDKHEFMIHAEANLVFFAAKMGISLNDQTVICTLSPCQNCIRTLFQAGVREIYYRDLYAKHDITMRDIKVTETKHGKYTHMSLTNHE
jgi:dCMP deaminase